MVRLTQSASLDGGKETLLFLLCCLADMPLDERENTRSCRGGLPPTPVSLEPGCILKSGWQA
jgi:hypothetical protein